MLRTLQRVSAQRFRQIVSLEFFHLLLLKGGITALPLFFSTKHARLEPVSIIHFEMGVTKMNNSFTLFFFLTKYLENFVQKKLSLKKANKNETYVSVETLLDLHD